MLYTRDMVHTYSVPDSLEGLPEYKKQAFMLAASGITPWLLTLNYNGVGDMDEYTDSSSELRSVGDDTVPTVEEKVTEQQGGDQLYEDAVESLRQSEAGEQPTPREELRMKPEEQQGESINYVEIDGDVDPTLTSTTVSSTEQGEPWDVARSWQNDYAGLFEKYQESLSQVAKLREALTAILLVTKGGGSLTVGQVSHIWGIADGALAETNGE